ncbi:MAG: hypothetical protein HY329_13380 [Chloroflexi bacterium]|nr:hypothetical protein [Chloroflexota bacterium]
MLANRRERYPDRLELRLGVDQVTEGTSEPVEAVDEYLTAIGVASAKATQLMAAQVAAR